MNHPWIISVHLSMYCWLLGLIIGVHYLGWELNFLQEFAFVWTPYLMRDVLNSRTLHNFTWSLVCLMTAILYTQPLHSIPTRQHLLKGKPTTLLGLHRLMTASHGSPPYDATVAAPPSHRTTPQDRETDANAQKASYVTRYSLSDYGGLGHAHWRWYLWTDLHSALCILPWW